MKFVSGLLAISTLVAASEPPSGATTGSVETSSEPSHRKNFSIRFESTEAEDIDLDISTSASDPGSYEDSPVAWNSLDPIASICPDDSSASFFTVFPTCPFSWTSQTTISPKSLANLVDVSENTHHNEKHFINEKSLIHSSFTASLATVATPTVTSGSIATYFNTVNTAGASVAMIPASATTSISVNGATPTDLPSATLDIARESSAINSDYLRGYEAGLESGFYGQGGFLDGFNQGEVDGYNTGVRNGFRAAQTGSKAQNFDEAYIEGETRGYYYGYIDGSENGDYQYTQTYVPILGQLNSSTTSYIGPPATEFPQLSFSIQTGLTLGSGNPYSYPEIISVGLESEFISFSGSKTTELISATAFVVPPTFKAPLPLFEVKSDNEVTSSEQLPYDMITGPYLDPYRIVPHLEPFSPFQLAGQISKLGQDKEGQQSQQSQGNNQPPRPSRGSGVYDGGGFGGGFVGSGTGGSGTGFGRSRSGFGSGMGNSGPAAGGTNGFPENSAGSMFGSAGGGGGGAFGVFSGFSQPQRSVSFGSPPLETQWQSRPTQLPRPTSQPQFQLQSQFSAFRLLPNNRGLEDPLLAGHESLDVHGSPYDFTRNGIEKRGLRSSASDDSSVNINLKINPRQDSKASRLDSLDGDDSGSGSGSDDGSSSSNNYCCAQPSATASGSGCNQQANCGSGMAFAGVIPMVAAVPGYTYQPSYAYQDCAAPVSAPVYAAQPNYAPVVNYVPAYYPLQYTPYQGGTNDGCDSGVLSSWLNKLRPSNWFNFLPSSGRGCGAPVQPQPLPIYYPQQMQQPIPVAQPQVVSPPQPQTQYYIQSMPQQTQYYIQPQSQATQYYYVQPQPQSTQYYVQPQSQATQYEACGYSSYYTTSAINPDLVAPTSAASYEVVTSGYYDPNAGYETSIVPTATDDALPSADFTTYSYVGQETDVSPTTTPNGLPTSDYNVAPTGSTQLYIATSSQQLYTVPPYTPLQGTYALTSYTYGPPTYTYSQSPNPPTAYTTPGDTSIQPNYSLASSATQTFDTHSTPLTSAQNSDIDNGTSNIVIDNGPIYRPGVNMGIQKAQSELLYQYLNQQRQEPAPTIRMHHVDHQEIKAEGPIPNARNEQIRPIHTEAEVAPVRYMYPISEEHLQLEPALAQVAPLRPVGYSNVVHPIAAPQVDPNSPLSPVSQVYPNHPPLPRQVPQVDTVPPGVSVAWEGPYYRYPLPRVPQSQQLHAYQHVKPRLNRNHEGAKRVNIFPPY